MKLRISFLTLFTLMSGAATHGIAQAQGCGGIYRCGGETYDDPARAPLQIIQPKVTQAVMGLCNAALPSHLSYQAKPLDVTCGETGQKNNRMPLDVKEDVADRWDILSRSGRADAQEEMQNIRKADVKWSSQMEFPLYERWSYVTIVGDYNSRQCGNENFQTTCYMAREEQYTYHWEEDVYEEYCAEYEEDRPSSYSSGGGSYGGGSSSSGGSSWSSGSPSGGSSGYGESYGGSRKDAEDSWGDGGFLDKEKYLGTYVDGLDRRPARSCARWSKRKIGTRPRSEKRWKKASPLVYSCTKQRPKWCTWPEVREATRSCGTHKVSYQLEFVRDAQWKPGFVASENAEARSYNDILPNKFDLLPGESEDIFVFGNKSLNRNLQPSVVIQNGLSAKRPTWNEYQTKITPESIRCEYGMKPHFKVDIHTLGRNKQRAPNPFVEGMEQLEFRKETGTSRPYALVLKDGSLETKKDAARISRDFSTLSRTNDSNAVYTDNGNPLKGTSASGGYWQESRFKLQLFRVNKHGRSERVTPRPESFGMNQIDVFGDVLTISLEGRDGMDRFYKSGGPFEFVFGGLYKSFGVELTPGDTYFLRLQTVSRGLPFYESGCLGGKAVCEGEEGSNESYSEPLDIKFVADPDIDNRSWFKKFKDLQKTLGSWL